MKKFESILLTVAVMGLIITVCIMCCGFIFDFETMAYVALWPLLITCAAGIITGVLDIYKEVAEFVKLEDYPQEECQK